MKDASSVIGLDSAENDPVIEVSARTSSLARTRLQLSETQLFWAGTGAVTAALARNGVVANDLRIEQADLEDAIIALTGRRLAS